MGRLRPGGARGHALAAVALAAALVAGACGSTADQTAAGSGTATGGTVTDELGGRTEGARRGDDPSATTAGGPADGRARTSRLGGRSGGASASQSGSTTTTVATSGAGRVPVGAGVPGVTEDAIRIGLVDVDLSVAAGAVNAIGGASPGYEDTTTTRPIGDALVTYINQQGGVAGRKIEVVWHRANATDLATAEGRRRDAQRACATWTEDNEVFAVMGRPIVSEVVFECARRNGVVVIPYHSGLAVDEQLFRELYPLWYSVNRMVSERRDRNLVDGLVRRGVLARGAKVGIMVEDWVGATRGVTNGMEPALAAHGIEVVAKAVYPDAVQSPWDTYVLQFRSAGVTHVLWAQTWARSGFDLLFMMRAAESQGWRPMWGIGSDNQPFVVARAGAPRPQLARTVGMGWQPEADLGRYDETAARAHCGEVAGQPIGDNGDEYWLTFCDVLSSSTPSSSGRQR